MNDYFDYSRKDRLGMLVLVSLIILLLALPAFFSQQTAVIPQLADTAWLAAARKLEINGSAVDSESDESPSEYQHPQFQRKSEKQLFYFDPNMISFDEWKKLGLRDKTIHTIQHFLGKGGYFSKPEDLQKIYGLQHDEYNQLYPYVKIQDREKKTANANTEHALSPNKIPRYHTIEINTADTSEFIALPGIGSKLALRIVNFREKLGGFYSIEQVKEIYGLPDSTFQKIKPLLILGNETIKKININTATADELKTHPYIRYNLANPIVAYRNEHGNFSALEDLKKIIVITDDIYRRILPYLEL